jgi:hypothetical protein
VDATSFRAPGFANPGVVASHFELHLGMGQQTQSVPDFLRNSHLSFACDPHRITPTGKCNDK